MGRTEEKERSPGGHTRPTPDGDSAIVVLVPEAEVLVANVRNRHDPSAREGMPAHVTLLYPFVPRAEIADETRHRLRSLAASTPGYPFTLKSASRFPNVLYLRPVPAEPFIELIGAITEAFPGLRPYGGAFDHPVPHLTVAQSADPSELDVIERGFLEEVGARLPLRAEARSICLVVKREARWTTESEFALGRPTSRKSMPSVPK